MENDGSDEVRTYQAAPHVQVVAVERPSRRNALNIAVKNHIADAVERLDADDDVRAIVLTGSHGIFAAGTDLEEMLELSPTQHSLLVTDRMFTTMRRSRTPLLAAVEGYALGGGCELALSCHLVVSGVNARFGQPEILVGVMPGAGATQRMVRAMGRARALRLLLTGEQIDGQEARHLGLISETVPDGDALPRAIALAETLAQMPPLAIRAILEVVDAGADAPLETALLLERKAFQLLFDTEDQVEGMRAFLDKRPPSYRGR